MKALIKKTLQNIKLKPKAQLGKKPPRIIYKGGLIERKKPLNLKETDIAYFAHEFKHSLQDTRLHEIENVSVNLNTGAVFKGLNALEDSFISPNQMHVDFTFYHYLFLRFKGKKKQMSEKETYLIVHNSWTNSIFHWLLDSLPRLYAVRDLTPSLTLLLPKSYEENDRKKGWTPFHLESLAPFKFKAILELEKDSLLNIPKLIVPSHTASSGNYNVEILQGLRKMYHDYFVHSQNKNSLQLGEKIYLTRQKALWRKVKNDDEVIPIMESYGFKVINLEDYTFAEKVQIAYHARIVISIFSSGQTIAAFMQKGSSMVDLRPKDKHNLSIYSLCDAMDVNYLYQFCDYVDFTEEYIHGAAAPRSFNLHVNTKELIDLLEQMT